MLNKIRSISLIILVFLVSLLFFSCLFVSYEGDFFWVEEEGALMPVWIRGNTESKKIILFLHGGPGQTSITMPWLDVFKDLEREIGIAYWDQRGSGSSRGNADSSTMTLSQFIEDCDVVVDFLQFMYPDSQIYLWGHSWGGMLGTAYLQNPERQSKISGWIESDGCENAPGTVSLSIDWMIKKANAEIEKGLDVEYWKDAVAYLQEGHDWWSDSRIAEIRNRCSAYWYDPSILAKEQSGGGSGPEWALLSPINLFGWFSTKQARSIIEEIRSLNLVPNSHIITIPCLITWGEHDGTVPVQLAYETFEALGSENKTLKIYSKSGHNPYIEEHELFIQDLRSFLHQY